MRLHRLTMSAVGPYPGTEVIDFDRFATSGRFLLTGPTGAGKTTIIDAIVFALYGDVSGDKDSSKDRIRSRLAGPGTETVVELVFSTSAGTYRVRRTPAYERLKLRGSGTTTQKASLKVWRLADPAGQVSEDATLRPDEAGPELVRAIGLSREQFTQTIVLPQGKFATFLRASSDERHRLLRDVFGTRVYDELQEELRRRSLAARGQAEQSRQRLRAAAEAFAEVVSHEPDGQTRPAHTTSQQAEASEAAPQSAPDEPDEPDEPQPTVHELLSRAVEAATPELEVIAEVTSSATRQAAARLREAQEEVSSAQHRRERARDELDEAQALAELLAQRRALLEAQEELEAGAQEAQLTAHTLDLAQRAASVAGMVQRAHKDAEAAAQALEQEVGELPADEVTSALLAQALSEGEQTLDEVHGWDQVEHAPQPGDTPDLAASSRLVAHLETQAREQRDRAAALVEAEATESRVSQRRERLERLRQEQERQSQQIEETRGALTSLPRRAEQLRELLATAHQAQERVPDLRSAHEAAERRAQAAEQVSSVSSALAQARESAEQARREADALEKQAHALRSAWINATSATLVGELSPGQPCPVCGSPEHPRPAPADCDPVSRADLDAADQSSARARQSLEAARAQVTTLQARLAQAEAAAEGRSPEQASAELTATSQALASAQEQAEPRTRLQEELDSLTARKSELQQRLSEHKEAAAATAATFASEQEGLERDLEQVTTARGAYASVASRRAELGRAAELAEALTARWRTVRTLVQAARASQQDLASEMAKAGFASRTDLEAARRGEAEVDRLAALVRERDAEVARVRAGLAQPQVSALTGQEEPGLSQARQVLAESEQAWQSAVSQQAGIQARDESVRTRARRLHEAATELATVVGDNAALLRVAALAAGENHEATPLATWVLTERFKEVLAFANHRLETMSGGRYELIQVDEEKNSARRRGLGMGVLDRLGGERTRDPRTLSGGETFYVSLALALALADVVATESGGTLMETLFVDEGFGSLDPQTLQDVLHELGRLQQGGRTVGIVSHVEELRRQIPDQVKVTATPEGSRLTVVAS
nr:SMC family ATPase [Actinomyces sp.]